MEAMDICDVCMYVWDAINFKTGEFKGSKMETAIYIKLNVALYLVAGMYECTYLRQLQVLTYLCTLVFIYAGVNSINLTSSKFASILIWRWFS